MTPHRSQHLLTPSRKSSIRIRSTDRHTGFKMPRRQHVTVLVMLAVAAFLTFSFVWTFGSKGVPAGQVAQDTYKPYFQEPVLLDEGILTGTATAPKLENATLK